ncbi:hypothetical protein [Streptomyces sp. MBT62]|nr:hypothetical protein [Streptomyces sp. MBT62]
MTAASGAVASPDLLSAVEEPPADDQGWTDVMRDRVRVERAQE